MNGTPPLTAIALDRIGVGDLLQLALVEWSDDESELVARLASAKASTVHAIATTAAEPGEIVQLSRFGGARLAKGLVGEIIYPP